jgi:hypothetical protein
MKRGICLFVVWFLVFRGLVAVFGSIRHDQRCWHCDPDERGHHFRHQLRLGVLHRAGVPEEKGVSWP